MTLGVKVGGLFVITMILDNLWSGLKGYIPENQMINWPLFNEPEYLYWYLYLLLNKVNITLFSVISLIVVNNILAKSFIGAYIILSICNIVEYLVFNRNPDYYYMWEILFGITVVLLYTRFKNNARN